ncbi:activating transcription factor 3-like [Ylistrum balloti]|uniref:activating transcription factor 3-like n=1 Tax=Ylistrum balloti TaxID=509963 RepID=UPI002905B42B|nr:activating transcription factor 3-like [Ylistrum balloti]
MVRVFVQKESCCSEPRNVGEGVCSGPREVIDRERAEMAVQAVTKVENGDTNYNFNNYNNYSAILSPDTSSQSSFCDSESDNGSMVINEGTGSVESSGDVMTKEEKRKARRRERNKKSAQAYRQRRRQQSGSQIETLKTLEGKNQELLQKVQRLEEEKKFIEELLKNKIKIPWHIRWALPPTWHQPTTTPPPTTTGMMTVAMGAPMSMGTEVTCAS